MPSSRLYFGAAAHRALAHGCRQAAMLAAGTMGPFGRAVLVERLHHAPRLLREGHGLLQELELEPGPAQMAVQTLRELAWRTVDAVGDGSSSAIVAAAAMFEAALPAMTADRAGAALQAELSCLVPDLMAAIAHRTRPIIDETELAQVAAMAAGDDRVIGQLVADALSHVGQEGVVEIAESQSGADSMDHATGLVFPEGWLSSGFAKDEPEGTIVLEDPLIVLHRQPIVDLAPLVRVLEMVAASKRALLIVAEDVKGAALTTLLLNRREAGLKVAAVKTPGAGLWRDRLLEDLAIATGGTIIAPERGTRLSDLRPAMLGRAARARVSRHETAIVEPRGDPDDIAARRAAIARDIEAEQHLGYDREQHRKRLARFSGGIATLKLGGTTATEAEDRRQRTKRALAAARSAQQHGVVAIGAALGALASLPVPGRAGLPALLARRLLETAVMAPLKAVADNRGLDGAAIARRLMAHPDPAYDVITNAVIDASMKRPVEAAAVLRTALDGAISSARTLMRVDLAISQAVAVEGAAV